MSPPDAFDFGDFEASGPDESVNYPNIRTTLWQNLDDIELVAEVVSGDADGATFRWTFTPVGAERIGYAMLGMAATIRGRRRRGMRFHRKALRLGAKPIIESR